MDPLELVPAGFVAHHKKSLIIGAVLVFTHLLAYGTGRYLQPERVVVTEKVKVVEVEKQVVVTQEKVKVEKVIVRDETKHIHREEHQVKHPDGLVEITKTEDINQEKVVKENQIQYVDRDIYHETVKYQDREVVKEKIVESKKPSWRLSPLLGASFPHWTNPQLVYGGEVQRRILGPISVGAWGLSSGQGGISASIEF